MRRAARGRASTTTPAGSPATRTWRGNYFGYDGPCPPWNDAIPHHYVFTLYALDVARLDVPARSPARSRVRSDGRARPRAGGGHRALHAQSGGEAVAVPRRRASHASRARAARRRTFASSASQHVSSGRFGERRASIVMSSSRRKACTVTDSPARRRARSRRIDSGDARRPSIATTMSPAASPAPLGRAAGVDVLQLRLGAGGELRAEPARGGASGPAASPPGLPPRSSRRSRARSVERHAERRQQFRERRILGAVDVAREEVAEIAPAELARDRRDAVLRHADAGRAVALPQRAHQRVERRRRRGAA